MRAYLSSLLISRVRCVCALRRSTIVTMLFLVVERLPRAVGIVLVHRLVVLEGLDDEFAALLHRASEKRGL